MSLPFFSLKTPHMEFYTRTLVGATSDWITRDEAKAHLRVDFTSDDSYIDSLLAASQEACEKILGFPLGNHTHVGYASEFSRVIFFRQCNLYQNPTVEYKNAAGSYVTLGQSDYKSSNKSYPGRIVFADTLHISNEHHDPEWLKVTWSSRYQTTPDLVKQAGLMIIGHLYEMRQDVGYSRVFEVPMNSKYLLEKYRKQSFV